MLPMPAMRARPAVRCTGAMPYSGRSHGVRSSPKFGCPSHHRAGTTTPPRHIGGRVAAAASRRSWRARRRSAFE